MTPVWQHETTGEVVGPDTIARMGEAGYVRLVPVMAVRAQVEALYGEGDDFARCEYSGGKADGWDAALDAVLMALESMGAAR